MMTFMRQITYDSSNSKLLVLLNEKKERMTLRLDLSQSIKLSMSTGSLDKSVC